MKFKQYLKENQEKKFIRIGPGSGQKQTHKGWKRAPEKKGVWLLPIQGAKDLAFLGSGSSYLKNPRIIVLKKYKDEYEKLEREMEKSNDWSTSSEILTKMDKIEMKSFKLNYKTFELKSDEMIWCHIGKGVPNIVGEWDWWKVSVSEYWELFKREWAKSIGGLRRSGKAPYIRPDWEMFEIFYPTT